MRNFKTLNLNLNNPHYLEADAEILAASKPYSLSDGEKVVWAQDLKIGLKFRSAYLEFRYPIYGANVIRGLAAKTLNNYSNVPIELFYDRNDIRNVKGFILK